MQAPKGPRVPLTLRPNVGAPLLDELGGGVARLHASDNSQLREPWDIVRMRAFDVDELVTSIASAVDLSGMGNGVERDADPTVSDRVSERLKSAPVELRDKFGELGRVPVGIAVWGCRS